MLTAPLTAADWPYWRGPTRDGLAPETAGWAAGTWRPDKPAWSANGGAGASSPLVVGDRVYVLGRSGGQDVVRCLNVADGKEMWAAKYKGPEYGRFHNGDEGLYSGPSSTPEYDPGTKVLYTLGPDGDLNAWDTNQKGKKVWGLNLYDVYGARQRPKLTRALMRITGTRRARRPRPVAARRGRLLGTLVAFDKATGKEALAVRARGRGRAHGRPGRDDRRGGAVRRHPDSCGTWR